MHSKRFALSSALTTLTMTPAFAATPSAGDHSRLVFEFITLPSAALLLSGVLVYWLTKRSQNARARARQPHSNLGSF